MKQWSEADLVKQFSKVGRFYFQIARAEDRRPVEPNRVLKSVGAETTFVEDLQELAVMLWELEAIAAMVGNRLRSKRTSGRTLTLKVKFADYGKVKQSRTVLEPIRETA